LIDALQLRLHGGRAAASVAATSNGTAIESKSLSLREISKRFGSVTALHPTSLDVSPGELVALLGPSGCGKTTTLRLIAGFEYCDTGRVMIGGSDVSTLPPNKRGLGMVFQNYSLFPHMGVAENIAFGLRMAGVAKADREAAARRMLELIRLPQFGDRQIAQLSGGQQQRVALARAIVTNPSVLLLDEPLGALDKNLREGMQFEIRQLQQRLGITSVMVTHDQDEAMTMSDRIVVMNHGRILQSGPPRDVYERPRTRFVAEFLGTANIFRCSVAQRMQHAVQVLLDGAPQAGTIELAAGEASASMTSGASFEIAIRPEKVLLDVQREGYASFEGRISQHVFRGAQHVYLVEVPALGASMYVNQQAGSGHAAHDCGEPVRVSFDPRQVVILEPDDALE
jgi:spermidine/putrescine ABC transporter ATP-binding subunit